jgi:hypothetical protein
MQLKTESI